MSKAHAILTGSDLHEPKGVSTATAGQVYISNGSGSGVWTDTGATIGTASFTTGDLKLTWKTVADSGWIIVNDGTIGDLSSGATTLASSTTQDLFALLWNNISNTYAAVSGGRGVSASADFAAHKTIALPKMVGRALALYGSGAGLTPGFELGRTFGESLHVLTTSEMPAHTHGVTDPGHNHTSLVGSIGGGGGTVIFDVSNGNFLAVTAATNTTGITINSAGSGVGHNIYQPTAFMNIMVKL